MGKTHFFLSGKGGIGKSFAAFLLAQYYLSRGKIVQCIDTDPMGTGIVKYDALGTKHIDILCEDPTSPNSMKSLFNTIQSTDKDGEIVIDCSNTSFLTMCRSLKENDYMDEIVTYGKMPFLHSVIVGGAACKETLSSFKALMDNFPNVPVVVWLNDYFGDIRIDGETFEHTRFFKDYVDRIRGIVQFGPSRNEVLKYDVNRMLADRLTFKEATTTSNYFIITKSRLRMGWRKLDTKISQLNI
ncbi:nucleotide-binding protein [Sneathiella aquimaris]|uniref:nucleotide-binding protein n=1 Tax=Sneathiella aquimaris TaxID=2599305 RepID=UPI00146D13EA|nr:hypothetical protein [Sneathiella aquimaris]